MRKLLFAGVRFSLFPYHQYAQFVEEIDGNGDEGKGEQTRRDFYAQLPLQTRAQRQAAEARLDALVRPMIDRYATQMGVCPQFLYYRATRSRWGLCHTGRGAICLSLYLLLMPEWCIEHTVVHEMCHLLVPDHGPRFHALMDRYFPRWREARAEMRRVSRMEELT